jgi:hypothetical protein
MAIPVTSDSGSQSVRYVFIQPQQISLNLNTISSVSSNSINLGVIGSSVPEYNYFAEIIIRYQGANWILIAVNKLTGTKVGQVSSSVGNYLSSVSVDGTTITGDGTINDPLIANISNLVTGPVSATDNAVARFDTTTGKLVQDSVVLIGDTGVVSGVSTINGVTIETHASRHNPGGADALALGTPSTLVVGGSNTAGTATSFVRSDHLHALPAFGSTSGTFCQGNDSRLSDDRTASGLRTATTVVSVSGATAPVAGQVLKATSSTTATWQNDTVGTGDVVGPGTSTDNAIPRFDGTTGKIIQNSSVIVDDTNNITGASTINSGKYFINSDLAITPIIDGQSVITSWYGIQLNGNLQSDPKLYTPSNVGAVDDYCVIIPSQQVDKITLGIRTKTLQTADILRFEDETGTELGSFDYRAWINIGQAIPLPSSPISTITNGGNGWMQLNIQNLNAESSASSDVVATADIGTDSNYYVDLGINSSTYNQIAYNIGGALDSYLVSVGGNLSVGTNTEDKSIHFHTGGSSIDNLIATIDDNGLLMNSFGIRGVSDPLLDQDAVTKIFLDTYNHPICITASTSDITLSGEQIIDGISVIAGNRVLVKNQSTASENGIYVVNSGLWTRASDFNSSVKVNRYGIISVRSGNDNANTFNVSNTNPNAIGTVSQGVSNRFSRQDHVHSHGNQSAGSLFHTLADSTSNGFVISTGTTYDNMVLIVNSSDAQSWSLINNINISSTANIDITKLSLGAASTILQSNGTTNSWGAFSDTLHGDRGGGNLHSLVSNLSSGFVPAVGALGTFLRSNGTSSEWATMSGAGDVVGPASSTDNAVVRFDLTTGKLIQDSVVLIGDTGVISGVSTINGVTIETHASRHQDGGSDEISVAGLSGLLADAQKVSVKKNSGTNVGTRPNLNFIESTGISITIADDNPNNEIDITIASTGGTGDGDVVGPTSATDNAVARFDTTTGKLIQDSVVLIGDTGVISGVSTINGVTIETHASRHQDGGADEISVTGLSGLLADSQKTSIRKNSGTDIGARPRINFIEGTNISLTITDDSVDNEVDVTIASVGAGSGDVVGPVSSVDNTIPKFDGITGKLIQGSGIVIDDSNNISSVGTVDGRDLSVDGAKLDTIESGAEVNNISDLNATALVGGGEITLHTHPSDGEFGNAYFPTWTATPATGVVTGPASATDNAIARFDLTTGKLVQNSTVIIDDLGNITGAGTINAVTITSHSSRHQDGGADEISVAGLSGLLADAQKVSVKKNSGTNVGTRPNLNFIESTGISITIADDNPNNEIDITIAATGGGAGGTGDVIGPGTATDNAAVRFDTTTGKLIQDSVVLIGDTGAVTGVSTINGVTIETHASRHQDGGSDEISVTGLSGLLADSQKTAIRKNSGTDTGSRPRINFIEGTNITLTIADDPTDNEVDVTIASSGGSGGAGFSTFSMGLINNTGIDVYQNDATWGGLVMPTSNVVINSLSVWVYQAGDASNITGGIYNASDNTLISTTGTALASTTGIKILTFSSGVSLTAGNQYYLAVSCLSNGSRFCGTSNAGTSFNISPKPSFFQLNSRLPATLSPQQTGNLIWIQANT